MAAAAAAEWGTQTRRPRERARHGSKRDKKKYDHIYKKKIKKRGEKRKEAGRWGFDPGDCVGGRHPIRVAPTNLVAGKAWMVSMRPSSPIGPRRPSTSSASARKKRETASFFLHKHAPLNRCARSRDCAGRPQRRR